MSYHGWGGDPEGRAPPPTRVEKISSPSPAAAAAAAADPPRWPGNTAEANGGEAQLGPEVFREVHDKVLDLTKEK